MSGIEGLEGFDKLFDLVDSKKINSTITNKVVRKGANIAKDLVVNSPNLPVSELPKKHARDYIKVKKIDDETYAVGYASTGNAFYLWFYENGTQAGTFMGSDGKLYEMEAIDAQPFMRPAIENGKEEIHDGMKQQLKKELKL